MLKVAEEAFDQIALAIEREIAMPLDQPTGFWRDHWLDAPLFEDMNKVVSVVCLVGEECLGFDRFQYRFCLADIRRLTWGQGKGDRVA